MFCARARDPQSGRAAGASYRDGRARLVAQSDVPVAHDQRNSLWRSSRSRTLASHPQSLPRSCSTGLTNRAALRNALLRPAASPPIKRPRSRPKKSEHQCFVSWPGHLILRRPHRRLAPSRGVRIARQTAFGDCRSIVPIAHFDEQAFVTHAGQIAARNANVGQVFRPDYSHLQGERDRAFSERWLRAPSQPDPLGSVPITLTNLDGGSRRSMEGNWQHKVRSFVQPGEPIKSATYRPFPRTEGPHLLRSESSPGRHR
jgi:hypothetical protein